MKSRLGNKIRLYQIVDAIELIEKALKNKTQADFERDFIFQAAVERWVEVIGEAAYNLSKEFKSKNSGIE